MYISINDSLRRIFSHSFNSSSITSFHLYSYISLNMRVICSNDILRSCISSWSIKNQCYISTYIKRCTTWSISTISCCFVCTYQIIATFVVSIANITYKFYINISVYRSFITTTNNYIFHIGSIYFSCSVYFYINA